MRAMSPEFYRIAHVVGALMLFLGLGGVLANVGRDGKGGALFLALHGIGLLVMLVAGIGFAHKSGLGWPNWLLAKIGCWLVLAVVPVMLRRAMLSRFVALLFVLGVAAAAVWLARAKPF
jgi:hypothetical protein